MSDFWLGTPMTGSAANQAWETWDEDNILDPDGFAHTAFLAGWAARRVPTVEEISEVLAGHLYNGGGTCTCDELAGEDINGRVEHQIAIDRHRRHLARVLSGLYGEGNGA